MRKRVLGFGLALILMTASAAAAQSVGQFRWQLQPYCNVVTLNVVQSGGLFQLDGYDDQCGGTAPRAAVVGTAFPNPSGLIGMGLTIVTAPTGTPLHVDASINPASVNGTWRDSSGNTGTFTFTPGAPVPGSARPAARAVFPAGLTAGGTTIGNVASPLVVTDAANRGYVDTVAASKANTDDVSLVVPLAGAGSTAALPPVALTLGSTTFTTPRTGFLQIDMMATGGVGCDSASATRWWIEMDGLPVRSSVRSVGGASGGFLVTGLIPVSLSGITATVVPAGSHSVMVRIGCSGGSANVFSTSGVFGGSVTVLPASYAPLGADAQPAADRVERDCTVERLADGAERRTCR